MGLKARNKGRARGQRPYVFFMPYNTDINDCPDQWRSPEFGRVIPRVCPDSWQSPLNSP